MRLLLDNRHKQSLVLASNYQCRHIDQVSSMKSNLIGLMVETNIGQVLSLYQLRAIAIHRRPDRLDTKHTPPLPLNFLLHIMNLHHHH